LNAEGRKLSENRFSIKRHDPRQITHGVREEVIGVPTQRDLFMPKNFLNLSEKVDTGDDRRNIDRGLK
jgi:hypothetical protein